MLLVAVAVGGAACGRMQARTAPPPVAMNVPPPPPRVAIPVSLPEQPIEEPVPEPPAAAPEAPPRPRPETPPRTVERPAPPPAPAAEAPAPVLQTSANVSALEQRASSLLGQAERDLERVNRAQLAMQARAQFDRAQSFIRNAKNAMQIKNYTFAEQLAAKAASLARELVKG